MYSTPTANMVQQSKIRDTQVHPFPLHEAGVVNDLSNDNSNEPNGNNGRHQQIASDYDYAYYELVTSFTFSTWRCSRGEITSGLHI